MCPLWTALLIFSFFFLSFFFLPFHSTQRTTTFLIYLLSFLSMIAFTATLSLGYLWLVFVVAACLGYAGEEFWEWSYLYDVLYWISPMANIEHGKILNMAKYWTWQNIEHWRYSSGRFFMTGYLPVGFEFAAEITYPAPEGTSSGLLNCFAQIFGFILTSAMSAVVTNHDPISANGMLCAFLFLGTVMTCECNAYGAQIDFFSCYSTAVLTFHTQK